MEAVDILVFFISGIFIVGLWLGYSIGKAKVEEEHSRLNKEWITPGTQPSIMSEAGRRATPPPKHESNVVPSVKYKPDVRPPKQD